MSAPSPIVEWAPNLGPYESTTSYLNLPGASGDYASTPDAAAWTFAGTYRIVVRARATDWTAAGTQALLAQSSSSGDQRSWRFEVTTAGALIFYRSTAGTAASEVSQTSSAPSLVDATTYWLGVEYVTATGAVSFYKANDAAVMPTIWTGWTLVSSHTMTSGTPYGSTAAMTIGAIDAGTADRLTGRIYEGRLYSSSTLLAQFWPEGQWKPASTTMKASTGETWTLAGASSIVTDWVDLTSYVQALTTESGRQYEVDQFRAGTAQLRLVSTDRIFDPDYTSGTYYGKLVPMRQFRVRMDTGTDLYPVFRGYVSDWGQAVPVSDRLIQTNVTLKDAFALLEATMAPSAYETEVLNQYPRCFFRFNDSNRLTDSSGNEKHGTFSTTPTLTAGLLNADGSRAWSVGSGVYATTSALAIATGNPRFDFWISTTATEGVIVDANITSLGARLMIYLSGGKMRFWASTAPTYYETTNVVNSGNATNIYFDYNTKMWAVNGVSDAGTSGAGDPSEAAGATPLGDVMLLGINQTRTTPFVGTLDEFSAYSTAVGNHYAIGNAPWSNQTTGARINAILDAIDWPSELRDISAGDSTMQIYDEMGTTAFAAILHAADTELGMTYVSADGKLTHRKRSASWLDSRSRTSQTTFGDVHSSATIKYQGEGFELVRDEALLRNPVTASRQNGTTIVVSDSAGITKYGQRSWSAPTSYDVSDNVIQDRASFLLSRFKDLATRVAAMVVPVHRDETNIAPVVGARQIGDRITVKRKPLGTGNEIASEQIIEGIRHQVAPAFWTTTYRASPADAVIYFILDDNDYGELDDDKLGY